MKNAKIIAILNISIEINATGKYSAYFSNMPEGFMIRIDDKHWISDVNDQKRLQEIIDEIKIYL